MKPHALRVIPLGGLGEIGKNMMALEYGDSILIVDAGVLFPGDDMPGVDFAIPNISYLLENRDRVTAILVTHGHEDHIGALPYIIPDLNVPIYASRLTHGLISVKLKEHGILKDAKLNVVEPYSPFRLKEFTVEFFRVCHSIPDAMGIAITTPIGMVVHTGDFKIDHTPADGNPTELAALTRLTSEGVLLLLSDSTYAEVDGYTPSEQVVGEALDHLIQEADGRVIIATFASLISRIQQVINAANRYGRKVTVVGRSMTNNVKMAIKMGYLNTPTETIITMKQAKQLPINELVVLATGAQGEPTAALARMANNNHKDIEIVPGDTVVVSASPIPGNETLVSKTINNICRLGAKVLYNQNALVHVHGHGSREELKLMLSAVKPKFFVPIHGEYRHLVAHASIAVSMGIPEDNTFILQDGDVLELTSDFGFFSKSVQNGNVFVDGSRLLKDDNHVLQERAHLSKDGIAIVLLTLDESTGDLIKSPKVTSMGFVPNNKSVQLMQKASEEAKNTLEQLRQPDLDWVSLKAAVTDAVSQVLYKETRRTPIVLTDILKIANK